MWGASFALLLLFKIWIIFHLGKLTSTIERPKTMANWKQRWPNFLLLVLVFLLLFSNFLVLFFAFLFHLLLFIYLFMYLFFTFSLSLVADP